MCSDFSELELEQIFLSSSGWWSRVWWLESTRHEAKTLPLRIRALSCLVPISLKIHLDLALVQPIDRWCAKNIVLWRQRTFWIITLCYKFLHQGIILHLYVVLLPNLSDHLVTFWPRRPCTLILVELIYLGKHVVAQIQDGCAPFCMLVGTDHLVRTELRGAILRASTIF